MDKLVGSLATARYKRRKNSYFEKTEKSLTVVVGAMLYGAGLFFCYYQLFQLVKPYF
ncbi:hypothetical protein SG34_032390 [Thalassomonas viridans]|uniref:Uncharacterized protein n=1 Tax=Thalassomonas viridans TaxID=137584 RepID=A0AAE9Z8C2_9GAMM|nr:hypothetical protein [Thalassomonas viridans]WDE08621.1 hypothetical protein SG34_032390 [Thalassomonas viridans]